jgi:hypothetical protein
MLQDYELWLWKKDGELEMKIYFYISQEESMT